MNLSADAGNAQRLFALLDLNFGNAGLFQQFDDFFYFSDIHIADICPSRRPRWQGWRQEFTGFMGFCLPE
jgi:hypothetical protein